MNTVAQRVVGLFLGVLTIFLGMLAVDDACATGPQVCTPYGSEDVSYDPQNVVLFMLDDVSWAEFPGLNLPIEWPDPDAPPSNPSTYKVLLMDATLRRPDLNRLAARVYARSNPDDCAQEPTSPTSVTASTPCLGTAQGVRGPTAVVPIDSAEDVEAFRYSTDATAVDPEHHILHGYGGLARLVRDGVAFSRYYSPSAKCSPSRAAVLTGRYPAQVGVLENMEQLQMEEITIAEYLKSMCNDDPMSGTPCYTTGYVGKWHLGEESNDAAGEVRALWSRGFDQGLFYPGKARPHWKTTDLFCPPAQQQFYCTSSLGGPTCSDDSGCDEDEACSFDRDDITDGHCYPKQPPDTCDPMAPSCGTGETCLAWGSYLGPDNRLVCHPEDVQNPSCCIAQSVGSRRLVDIYSFRKKVDGNKYWVKDTGNDRPCEDNFSSTIADFDNEACRYDTRYFRDVARNFILRNAPRSATDNDKRFFLYFAPHALHKKSGAPHSTMEHYITASLTPKYPSDSKDFWGALEEVDAAVGQIMQMINGYCDGDPTELLEEYGYPCTTNGDCDIGGDCNTYLRDNTLVLFTTDQGRPSSGYGEPMFRDGKGSVYEGGIRTGLLAWGRGLKIGRLCDGGTNDGENCQTNGDCQSGTCSQNVGPDSVGLCQGGANHHGSCETNTDCTDGVCSEGSLNNLLPTDMGSHVDLFATVAHAAKCEPTDATLGRYEVDVCNNYTREFCTQNSDCSPNGTVCEHRLLPGRTLLPALSTVVAADTDIETRDFIFAQYQNAGKTVAARDGVLDVRVCERYDDAASDTDRIARVRRAGSCIKCPTGGCGEVNCRGEGKFCVPDSDASACLSGLAGCTPIDYARCDAKACASGSECKEVKVDCSHCAAASAWKARGGEGTPIAVVDLFDLVTNPEEYDHDDLNCQIDSPNVVANTIDYVQDQLRRRVNGWWNCVTNPAYETVDCDNEMTQ